MTPFILAFGVWTMISGRIGRDPASIEGPLAVILGAILAAFAVALFLLAWSERGRTDV